MSRVGCFALIFFGLLAFFNAIRHPFVHDDVAFILNNPHITELGSWPEAFKANAAPGGINTYYRPVLEVLYRFEYHLFGPHPFGFHFFNVVVHIINGLLLFALLQRLGLREAVTWVIACIFLVHPVQTEAVSCISGISNLWMALGVLLALHAYLNQWYTVSLLCFSMAFLSKEQAVMFVPLVMVIDYSRGKKDFFGWLFWAVSVCILWWLRQSVTGASLLKDIMVSPRELYLRLAAVPRDIGMYVRLIFCPYDLHYYRSTDILQSNTVAWTLALMSVAGIFYVFNRWPRARATLILGLGWFLAALLPVLNIVPLINEYSFILTPEHFLYLPMVGILIVVVCAADYFLTLRLRSGLILSEMVRQVIRQAHHASNHAERSRSTHHYSNHTELSRSIEGLKHFFMKLLVGVAVAGCLLLTWHQNTFWKSEIALFERMLRFEPDFGRGHLLLAKAYYFNGRPQDAEEHFRKAFAIMSGYAKKAANPIAGNFYSGNLKQILFYWARNENARGHPDPSFVRARNNLQRLGAP